MSLLILTVALLAVSPCSISLSAAQPVPLGTATISSKPLAFQGAINPNFYTHAARKCVLTYFREHFAEQCDSDDLPPVVRLAFHDAMAGGANGSLMKHRSEQLQSPTLDGYGVIERLRNQTRTACGVPLSYADTLVLASASGTHTSGGKGFLDKLQLGRIDVDTADSPSLIPNSYWTTVPGYERWRQVGFSVKDFVAISGAHTIGCASCTTIIERLTVLKSTWLNSSFRQYLAEQCKPVLNGSVSLRPLPVAGGGPTNNGPQIDLDHTTPNIWDNGYFKNLLASKGVLLSDQALLSDSTIPETRKWVEKFASDNDAFLEAYENAFVKMSVVGLVTEHLKAGQYPKVPSATGCFGCCPRSTTTMPGQCHAAFNIDVLSSHSVTTSDLLRDGK